MKKTLSIVLTLAMLIGMLPMMASAAEINTLDLLKTAITNASANDTITLTGDITVTAGPANNIVIDKAITIDGAGFTITREFNAVADGDGYGDYEAFFVVAADGVTIQNLTMTASGSNNGNKDEGFVYIKADGTTVTGCTFNGKEGLTGVITEYNKGTDLVVTGNTFNNTKYAGWFNAATNAEISGNTVATTKYNGFYLDTGSAEFANNTLTDIGTANYAGYADGITAAAGTTVTTNSNNITLASNNTEGAATAGPIVDNTPVYGGPVMNQNKIGTAQNGYIKTSPIAASEGATITIYSFANEGFELASVTVTDKNGEALELTQNSAGRWTYKVPAGGVTVTPVFAAK